MSDCVVTYVEVSDVSTLFSIARGETDRSDPVSGSTLRHQSRYQRPHKPSGPVGRLQPCQPHRDPH